MPERLADRLRAARRRQFVGRTPEVDLFRAALLDADPPFNVLLIHGPGGVGKTTLLHEYRRIAEASRTTVLVLDGRSVEPSPAGVLLGLRRVLGLSDTTSPLDALCALSRSVVLLDTCETLAPLDGWFRETFLPQMPARTLVVMAGRNAPAPGWRTDGGWGGLFRVISLRNLLPDESRALLRSRGVPEAQHPAALAFTHGHPLALSLVADVLAHAGGHTVFAPERAPDVVRDLLEKFVQDVPGPSHRQALRLSAIVRVTTEGLLAAVLPEADARELFEWLAGLSFIEHGPRGLFPHDLARDVLDADHRWRDPASHGELFTRARDYLVHRMQEARGAEQQWTLIDGLFLLRNLPVIKPYFDWRQITDSYGEPAERDDLPEILAMVERHEGPDSASLAAYWFERQPQAFTVIRGGARQLIGFLVLLDLHEATPEDRLADPAVGVCWDVAHRRTPPRPGEELLLQRMWMDHEAYQATSVTYLVISSILSSIYLTRHRLALSFHPGADPDYWAALLEFMNFERCEEADFTIGDRHFGNWLRDWRAEPAPAWVRGIAERGTHALSGAAHPRRRPRAPLIVLSDLAFAEAVRQALRDYTRPAALERNPLLRSRVLVDRAGEDRTPAALQALLLEAAETLRGAPRTEKFYRSIECTYLRPAASQEKAAEQLGLPFNTYRYHLANGIARITEWLWARELHGPDGGGTPRAGSAGIRQAVGLAPPRCPGHADRGRTGILGASTPRCVASTSGGRRLSKQVIMRRVRAGFAGLLLCLGGSGCLDAGVSPSPFDPAASGPLAPTARPCLVSFAYTGAAAGTFCVTRENWPYQPADGMAGVDWAAAREGNVVAPNCLFDCAVRLIHVGASRPASGGEVHLFSLWLLQERATEPGLSLRSRSCRRQRTGAAGSRIDSTPATS
jgi:hypothetical protein